jgi:hypothetical protein
MSDIGPYRKTITLPVEPQEPVVVPEREPDFAPEEAPVSPEKEPVPA